MKRLIQVLFVFVMLALMGTLASAVDQSSVKPFTFTIQQQEFFSKNLKYYVYFSNLHIGKMSPAGIEKKYHLKPEVTLKYLKRLEELKLISLKPGLEVQIIPQGNNHTWSATEPMGKAYNTGFLDNLVQRSKDMTEGKSSVNAYLSRFLLTKEERDQFEAEYQALRTKYRQISLKRESSKNSDKPPGQLTDYATSLLIGENRFNSIFYPEIDNNI